MHKTNRNSYVSQHDAKLHLHAHLQGTRETARAFAALTRVDQSALKMIYRPPFDIACQLRNAIVCDSSCAALQLFKARRKHLSAGVGLRLGWKIPEALWRGRGE